MICNTRIRDSKVLLSSHLVVATSFLRSNTAIPKAALFLKSAFEKNKQHLIFFFLHENVPRETGFGRIYYDILHSCYILSLGQIIICVCVLSLLDHLKDSCYWAAIENSLCRAPCGAFFLAFSRLHRGLSPWSPAITQWQPLSPAALHHWEKADAAMGCGGRLGLGWASGSGWHCTARAPWWAFQGCPVEPGATAQRPRRLKP